MTRKRYIKLMMALGVPRNEANYLGIDPAKARKSKYEYSEHFIRYLYAHRRCWPFDSYEEAYHDNEFLVTMGLWNYDD